MIKILLLLITFCSFSFAIDPVTSLNSRNIYGCFKISKLKNYTKTLLIFRDEAENHITVIKSLKSDGFEKFHSISLEFEGTNSFSNSNDRWNPVLHKGTFYTAKGNLAAFSIQKHLNSNPKAIFSEFKNEEELLLCSYSKQFISNLWLDLIL